MSNSPSFLRAPLWPSPNSVLNSEIVNIPKRYRKRSSVFLFGFYRGAAFANFHLPKIPFSLEAAKCQASELLNL
jgi:hypothetical protein